MYNYVIVSVHPKTYSVTHRSYHKDHDAAQSSLKEEAANFITLYKRYQTVLYINNLDEIAAHPKIKYFLRMPDEKSEDRIEVYERVKQLNKGYVWNSSYYELKLIKIFDVVPTNFPSKDLGSVSNTVSGYQWAEKLNANTKESNQKNVNQIALMDELTKKVMKRRQKFNYE